MLKTSDQDLCRAVIDALTPQTPAVRYRAAVAAFKRRTETRPSKPIVDDVKPGTVRHRGVTLYRTRLYAGDAGYRGDGAVTYSDGSGRSVELRRMPAFRARPYTRPEDRVVVERGAMTIGNMRPHVETRESIRFPAPSSISRMDALRAMLPDTLEDWTNEHRLMAYDIQWLRDHLGRRDRQRDARRIRMAAKRRRGWR